MASDVSICNGALIKIGGALITSLTDDSNEARACNLIYTDTRDAIFRLHPWNCISERKTLVEVVTPPAFGFDHQFQLPSDCLRVLTLNEIQISSVTNGIIVYNADRIKFKIEGRKLLTDDTEAKILYISRVKDPNQYDVLLLEALKARLASELAYPIAKNAKLVQTMWEIYQGKLAEARNVDGMEGSPDAFESDEIGGARI